MLYKLSSLIKEAGHDFNRLWEETNCEQLPDEDGMADNIIDLGLVESEESSVSPFSEVLKERVMDFGDE